jgi:uncharacterized glyoxalase superfamily protein PhnB
MNPTPKGWPRLSASGFYLDANAAIDWLCKVFGFEVRLKVEGEGGIVEHSELVYGEALYMVGDVRRQVDKDRLFKSPKQVGGANTQAVMIFVDDVDAHHAHSVESGARIVYEPKTSDYGEGYWSDRSYGVLDCDDHLWWFCQRLKTY